jgi:hypothetical protein
MNVIPNFLDVYPVSRSDNRISSYVSLMLAHGCEVRSVTLPKTLPNTPICAIKLGDRTPLTCVPRSRLAGDSRARSSSTATPPVRFGEEDVDSQGVFPVFSRSSESDEKVPSYLRISWRRLSHNILYAP